jgi:hypothetical protein
MNTAALTAFAEERKHIVRPEIPEGKYRGKLAFIPESEKDVTPTYIIFTYEILVDGKPRKITDVKNAKGRAIMWSHLRKQYDIPEDEVDVDTLLAHMLEGVDIWLVKVVAEDKNGYMKPYTNVSFLPPLEKAPTKPLDEQLPPAPEASPEQNVAAPF